MGLVDKIGGNVDEPGAKFGRHPGLRKQPVQRSKKIVQSKIQKSNFFFLYLFVDKKPVGGKRVVGAEPTVILRHRK